MLLSTASRLYQLDVIRFSNQSAKTEENHLVMTKALIGFLGDVEVESITFSQVRDFKMYLEKSRSSETVRNYIIKLRVMLRFLKDRGCDVLDPKTIPVPGRTDKVPSYISPADVTLLIASTQKVRNKAIIAVLYASGVRVSELCRMNRMDVHNASFTVVGKGGKARLCFLDGRSIRYLQEYLATRTDNDPALFISDLNKRRVTPGNIQEILKHARARSKLDIPITPHTLRHSFATNLLQNNMNARYVQRLLGHTSLDTTMMYMHVVDVDLESRYKEHHSI